MIKVVSTLSQFPSTTHKMSRRHLSTSRSNHHRHPQQRSTAWHASVPTQRHNNSNSSLSAGTATRRRIIAADADSHQHHSFRNARNGTVEGSIGEDNSIEIQQSPQQIITTTKTTQVNEARSTRPLPFTPASTSSHNSPNVNSYEQQRMFISSIVQQQGASIEAANGRLNFVDEGKCMVRDFCMPRDVLTTSPNSGLPCSSSSFLGSSDETQQHFNRNQIMLSSFAICFQKFHFIEPTKHEFSLHRSGEFRLEDPNWVYLFSPKHDSYDAYLVIVRKSSARKHVSRDVIMHYDMKLLDPQRPNRSHILPVTGKAIVVSNSTRVPQELHILLQNAHFIGCDYEIRKIPEDIVEQVQKASGYDLWVFIQVQRTKERRLLSAFDPEIIQPNGPLADVDVVVVEVDDWAEDEKEANAVAGGGGGGGVTVSKSVSDSPTASLLAAAAAGDAAHQRKRARLDPSNYPASQGDLPLSGSASSSSHATNGSNTTASSQQQVLALQQQQQPLRTYRLRLDRNILAARSGFFRDQLTRIKLAVDKGAAEDTYQTWQLQINCKVDIFQKIVRYIYYGEVNPISLDFLEAVDMFKAVHKLRLGELKKAILERMAFILQEGKYLLEAYCFANKYQIAPLKRHVEMLSLKFPGKTFQGDDWMSFVEYCPNLVANMLEGVL